MGKLIPDSVRLAWLNLQRNRRRSLLSMLIIAIAVFALTSAGGFGLYTYDSLKEATARDTGHLTLTTPGYFTKEEEMPLSNGLSHADAFTKQLIGINEVRGVQPRVEFNGLVSNGSKSSIFIGIGVNDREFDMKGPFLDVREGQTLSNIHASRYDPAQPEVMLGVDLASNLNVYRRGSCNCACRHRWSVPMGSCASVLLVAACLLWHLAYYSPLNLAERAT